MCNSNIDLRGSSVSNFDDKKTKSSLDFDISLLDDK